MGGAPFEAQVRFWKGAFTTPHSSAHRTKAPAAPSFLRPGQVLSRNSRIASSTLLDGSPDRLLRLESDGVQQSVETADVKIDLEAVADHLLHQWQGPEVAVDADSFGTRKQESPQFVLLRRRKVPRPPADGSVSGRLLGPAPASRSRTRQQMTVKADIGFFYVFTRASPFGELP